MIKVTLKYPIILVHGIAAKDSNLFWGRIPKRLEEAGIQVFRGNTDSWGSIESNALSLKKTVDYVLNTCQTEKVNLIAHSKGGLDSRYLISTLGYHTKIASLTTISTPHHGAEIVDSLFNRKPLYTPFARKIVDIVMKLYGDKSPDPYKILSELRTENMIHFNQQNPNHKDVYYCSYHSIMKNALDDLSYSLSYLYIHRQAGDNDGIVSLRSSQWGKEFTLIQNSHTRNGISHAEILDIKRQTISGVDIPMEYVKMAQKLAEKGF
ncbi:alpha/beta fold hydrolase [Bacteroides sp. 224]|uniref:lipase family alpha/beta hydrolase n=1 Tax=Bacteroides sp. 224 TaxID=2302936 RepID=UPI0013D397A9|nr:alpha/beta fold hydrolase [Bacteroides sp. 224]NDV66819.1 alpha/beta hydrolase [Bacteroides sp. 224]